MNDNPTRLLNQTLILGDNPDDIEYADANGHPFIVLGHVSIAVGDAGQNAIDKLAVVVAQAAAEQRARSLRAVA